MGMEVTAKASDEFVGPQQIQPVFVTSCCNTDAIVLDVVIFGAQRAIPGSNGSWIGNVTAVHKKFRLQVMWVLI